MNHALQDSSTVERSEFFMPDASDTSRRVRHASGNVTNYAFRAEASSAAPQGFQFAAIKSLFVYQAYREVADSDTGGTSGGFSSLMIVSAGSPEVGEQIQPSTIAKRNEAAIALLESWLAAPETEEDEERLESFIEKINEDRLSERKLFP